MRRTDATTREGEDTIARRETESNLRGAAKFPLLLTAGAGAILLYVLLARPPRGAEPERPAGERPVETGTASPPPPVPAGDAGAESAEGSGGRTPGDAPAGKARLRVLVLDPPEGPRREDCVVSIGPTSLLLSQGTAVERSAVLPPGTDRCLFADLPDAAYLVRATGPGLSPVESPMAIGPAGREILVRLVLRRAVFVDGSIVDEEGAPLEGVLVRLDPERPGGTRGEARADAAGRYRIDGVVSGTYRILVGPLEAPFLEPVRAAIEDAPLRHDVRLPLLGALEVTVVDEEGRPLAARLDGWGPPGGTFHGETSPEGIHLARNLPPGGYRVVARAERRETRFEEARVSARETARLRLALREER